MDSGNLTLVLALTLIGTAVMFLVIAWQLRGQGWVATFAAGLVLFGLVFAVPTGVDAIGPRALTVLIDALAVAAVLALRRGLQLFLRRTPLAWRSLLALVAVYAALSASIQLGLGAAARDVVLEVTLALAFAWVATLAARESRGDNPLLRLPLLLLAGVLALLCALSLVQGLHDLWHGSSLPPSPAAAALDVLLMSGALLLGPALLWMHTAQLAYQLGELAMRDPLTRLLNENGLDELLRRHFARRQHEPLTLMLVDVDRLARINDRHGHVAGDDVLRLIALALESGLRADDLVARVGGEEFVVGCVGGDRELAARLAERLRAAVADIQTGLADGQGLPVRCTISIGVSGPMTAADQYRPAWGAAEAALQAAKDAGGNSVRVAP